MTCDTQKTTGTIDRDQLLQRCLGIQAFADKLANSFVSSLPGEKSTLRSTFEARDMEHLARHAHRLRGSAYNLCANQLSQVAEALETAAKGGVAEALPGLMDEIERAIESILHEFVKE